MSSDFKELQYQFANFCRGKQGDFFSGWTQNQPFSHYQTLVFNNVYSALKSTYPLTFKYLQDEEFTALTKRFFAEYNCQSPQLWQMPKELISYLEMHEPNLFNKHFLLNDLLQFEWTKTEVFYMPNEPILEVRHITEYITEKLVLNPEMKLLGTQYPVHLLGPPEIIETHKNNYFIAINRHTQTGQVHTTDLSLVLAKFILALHEEPTSFQDFWQAETKSELPNEARQQVEFFIQNALTDTLILGVV